MSNLPCSSLGISYQMYVNAIMLKTPHLIYRMFGCTFVFNYETSIGCGKKIVWQHAAIYMLVRNQKFMENVCLYFDVKTVMSIPPCVCGSHYFDHVVVYHYFECTLLNMKAYKNN